MPDSLHPFDDLYRRSPDPWGTASRWYERRKRALLLASLPRPHYGSAYEAGCGTGHISVVLAERCDTLIASDASAEAIGIAAKALTDRGNVTLARHRLPDDWPARPFDLIVLSEVLYFVDDAAQQRVAAAARGSAGSSGLVIACNWRDTIESLGHRGDEVHRRFEERLGLPRLFEYIDQDFMLSGWSADATAVATRDGLRG